jgi:hypothetical protein
MDTNYRLEGGGYNRDDYARFGAPGEQEDEDMGQQRSNKRGRGDETFAGACSDQAGTPAESGVAKRFRTHHGGELGNCPASQGSAPVVPTSGWYVSRLYGVAFCSANQVCSNRQAAQPGQTWIMYANAPRGAYLLPQTLTFGFRHVHPESGIIRWWYFCANRNCLFHLYNHPELSVLSGVKFTGVVELFDKTTLTSAELEYLAAQGIRVVPSSHS